MTGELIDTAQMYLRTVYELLEADIEPRRARIVERLHQAGPTVSQTVARMERDGLLILNEERELELTDEGFMQSLEVMRCHRLSECLLVNSLGLDIEVAHEEACRWEHVISQQVADKIALLLGQPTISPYGTPIPLLEADHILPLSELGMTLVDAQNQGLEQVEYVLADEYAQCNPHLMAKLHAAGIRPGVSVRLSKLGTSYALTSDEAAVQIPADFAGALRVK